MKSIDPAKLLRNFPTGPPVADGKSKTLHPTAVPGVCLMAFKPHARSVTSRREEDVPGSDYWRLLATLDTLLHLEAQGIPTHLRHPKAIAADGKFYLAVARAKPIQIEWIVRYEAAGSIVRLFPSLARPGQRFDRPLFKYDYKQDVAVAGVDDPTLNESYILGLGLLKEGQLREAQALLATVGEQVRRCLAGAGIRLIDMKVEFGFDDAGRMVLIDEVSQDCIRAADETTGRPLTKDLFRQLKSPDEVVAAYEVFARKLNSAVEDLVWKAS
jgi:phosphoribosylaminoimidazole-succinocarboxamide synthase